jgi:hypothetical protein
MVMDVGASPDGDSAPGDPEGDGSDGPVLAVGDPGIDGLGVAGGDVEVHADITRSNAIRGTADARRDAIPGTLSSSDPKPGNATWVDAVARPRR